jgi:hypothetical protein
VTGRGVSKVEVGPVPPCGPGASAMVAVAAGAIAAAVVLAW